MAQNITLMGASYTAVPAVNLPKTGGGTARFTDVSDSTAVAADVASGKYFYLADGTRATGTNSGGGGASNCKTGTLTVSADVKTATSTKITDTTELGFTPKAFMLIRSAASSTRYHLQQTSFATVGSTYYRVLTYRGSSSYSTTSNTSNWTTQTAGYLYFNSDTVYYRSSTSYYLEAGTYYWVAYTW